MTHPDLLRMYWNDIQVLKMKFILLPPNVISEAAHMSKPKTTEGVKRRLVSVSWLSSIFLKTVLSRCPMLQTYQR